MNRGRALDDRTRVACDVARTLYVDGRHGALGAYLDNLRASDAELADVVLRDVLKYAAECQKG